MLALRLFTPDPLSQHMMSENANDAVTLRREARRRKILENSNKRLKLIEGINTSQWEAKSCSSEEKPSRIFEPHSDLSNNINTPESNSKLNELLKETEELKDISDFCLQDEKHRGDDLEDEEQEEIISEVESSTKKISCNFFFEKRLHYILLAFVVNILFYLDAGYLFYENIFCPFYTVKAIEFLSRGKVKEDFQPFVFLFMAGLPKNVQKLMKIVINLFSIFLSDLFLYIFTFVMGIKLINMQL